MEFKKLKELFVNYFSNIENCTLTTDTAKYGKVEIYLLNNNTTNFTQAFRLDDDGFIDFWGDFRDRESFDLPIFNVETNLNEEYYLKLFNTIKDILFEQVQVYAYNLNNEKICGTIGGFNVDDTLNFTKELGGIFLNFKDAYGKLVLNSENEFKLVAKNFSGTINNEYLYKNGDVKKLA